MTTLRPYLPQPIGNLRHRVWLQKREVVTGPFNEQIQVWRNHARVWARIEPLKGFERMAAGGIQDASQAIIHIRYRDGINAADWRIIEGETEQQGDPAEDVPAPGAIVHNITGTRQLDERCAYLALDVTGARQP